LKVTSLDTDTSPLTTIGVLVKSGSSFETYDNLGVSQALRLHVGLTTKNSTSFGLMMNLQQMAANVNVIGSREYLLYSLIAPRHCIPEAFDFFNEMVTSPSFKAHEIGDNVVMRMEHEIGQVDMSAHTMELLHKVAYRNGLGNSLYSPDYMVGKHKSAMLADFHAKTHTVTRSVVAGHGIDHTMLTRLCSKLQLEKGHGPTQPCKYFGGEIREDHPGKLTTIAIGGQTAGSDNIKENLTFMLLRNILGNGPHIKRGNLSGKLGKAVAKIEGQKAVGGFQCSYQDSGLAGALITCEPAIAGNVVAEVMAALRSVSVTEEELQAAKKVLRMDMAECMLNSENLVETLASHTMVGVDSSSGSVADLLNTVSTSDINAAAKKLVGGKLSMSAVGNLKNLPYLEDL